MSINNNTASFKEILLEARREFTESGNQFKKEREDFLKNFDEKLFNLPFLSEAFGFNSILRGIFTFPRYLSLAETKNGDRILDSGSAFGSIFFASRGYAGLELISLDLNHRMTFFSNYVKKVLNFFSDTNNRYVIQASSNNIPLADGSIDTIIDSYSLIHVINKKQTLDEYKRVLKPSGTLMLATPLTKDILKYAADRFCTYEKIGFQTIKIKNNEQKY